MPQQSLRQQAVMVAVVAEVDMETMDKELLEGLAW
jgi:hypothetical protein